MLRKSRLYVTTLTIILARDISPGILQPVINLHQRLTVMVLDLSGYFKYGLILTIVVDWNVCFQD